MKEIHGRLKEFILCILSIHVNKEYPGACMKGVCWNSIVLLFANNQGPEVEMQK